MTLLDWREYPTPEKGTNPVLVMEGLSESLSKDGLFTEGFWMSPKVVILGMMAC